MPDRMQAFLSIRLARKARHHFDFAVCNASPSSLMISATIAHDGKQCCQKIHAQLQHNLAMSMPGIIRTKRLCRKPFVLLGLDIRQLGWEIGWELKNSKSGKSYKVVAELAIKANNFYILFMGENLNNDGNAASMVGD